jgi:pimeloyl-ACP methyl ester carboxylesterase
MKLPRKLVMALVVCLSAFASIAPNSPGSHNAELSGVSYSIAQSGTGNPVVVFENGLASHKEVWNSVAPEIAKTNTVFTYDRTGQGGSSSSNEPRKGSHIVEELRSLLKAQGLQPPYVLVGHSLGGLYMQLYARKYPQEVSGLVLVDSTHPLHFANEGAPEKRSILSRAVVAVGMWGNTHEEYLNIAETGKEVLGLAPLRAEMPAIILIAPQTSPDSKDVSLNRDNDLRWDFAKLYPHAQVRETHTGHNVHGENPQLVAQAILEVVKVKGR